MALLGHTALMDVDGQYILNQRVGLIRSKDRSRLNFPYLYILTNSEAIIADLRRRANSGVQVNLSTSEIKKTQLLIPSKDVHEAFDKLVGDMYEKIFNNQEENSVLSKLRDTLLPKLISGELPINNAEKFLEQAGV